MNKRIHVRISGRVQGVSYRAYAQRQAQSLGLTGWVRNLSDGRVELVAEGPADRLEALLAWCREGPRFARVDGVEKQESEPTGEFNDFAVRRDGG
jgi:acylphosphatase